MPSHGQAQATYWMLTIPHAQFLPYLPPTCSYIKGQLEQGANGFLHWQVVAVFKNKTRLGGVREVFGPAHAEPTKSKAAMDYVWKEETRVGGTQFELGRLAIKRNNADDWEIIWEQSKRRAYEEIPADIRMRCFTTINRIADEFQEPQARPGVVTKCYVGVSGSGKTFSAYTEAPKAYWKDSTTIWWDGYKGQEDVIIDEFRGGIALELLLRWLDGYPVSVQVKGGSRAIAAKRFWITSNKSPALWYPDLDEPSKDALLRRLQITWFEQVYVPAVPAPGVVGEEEPVV